MEISNNKRVDFHYVLRERSNTLESSRGGEPMRYIHGHNLMLPGVEQALVGKKKGDKFEITLAPEQAYGEHDPQQVQPIPAKLLKHPAGLKKPTWRKGMLAVVQTSDGPRQVTVKKSGKFTVECDTNHPFSGKTLSFDIEVMDVQEATEEELSTGAVNQSRCCDDDVCCG